MFGQSTRGTCLAGVMANSGFGELTIRRQDVVIFVPVSGMKAYGVRGELKEDVATRLHDLSVENMTILNEKYGVRIQKVNVGMARETIQEAIIS